MHQVLNSELLQVPENCSGYGNPLLPRGGKEPISPAGRGSGWQQPRRLQSRATTFPWGMGGEEDSGGNMGVHQHLGGVFQPP